VDRFNLAMDAIDQVPWFQSFGAHVKDWLRDQVVENLGYADEHGIDKPEIRAAPIAAA
jgi:xylulose-5-phosphate/fructose-6-phosphate phosphoketolase